MDGWEENTFQRCGSRKHPTFQSNVAGLDIVYLLCKLFFFLFRAFHTNWIFQICYYRNIYWRKIVLQSYFQLYKDAISALVHHAPSVGAPAVYSRQMWTGHPAHQHTSLPRVVMLPASARTRLLPSVFLGSYTTAAHACPVIYLSKYQCVYYRLFPLWPSLVAQQKRICLQRRGCRLDPWVKKIPWRRTWQPTPAFLAWKIPWAEEPGGLESMGSQSRIWLSMHAPCHRVNRLNIT